MDIIENIERKNMVTFGNPIMESNAMVHIDFKT